MKGFIILAVTSFLVGVQASSISRVQKELDIDESKTVESPWILEELDGTSPNGALEEVQNLKAIADVLHFLRNYKDVMACSGNTCEWCLWSVCVKVSYLPNSKEFQFCATYNGNNVYCQSFQAKNLKYCKTVVGIELCIETMNVSIKGGKICMDLKISADMFSCTFSALCLGSSIHSSIA